MAIDTISMNSPGLDRSLAFRDSRLPGTLQSGTAYTPELADIEKVIRFTGAVAAVLTVPSDDALSFPIGTVLTVARDGAGAVTIAAAAGVTINRDAGTTAAIATQYSLVNLRKTAANTWSLFGALVAA
jgi:hypothetical protein